MASPDYDVSRRGGDVGPHRHLEDQTDHSLFFCHLSSRVAKHYSHASWSLRSPCGICCFAPNICSSLPELCGMTWSYHAAGATGFTSSLGGGSRHRKSSGEKKPRASGAGG